jgi:hypothetical protein
MTAKADRLMGPFTSPDLILSCTITPVKVWVNVTPFHDEQIMPMVLMTIATPCCSDPIRALEGIMVEGAEWDILHEV